MYRPPQNSSSNTPFGQPMPPRMSQFPLHSSHALSPKRPRGQFGGPKRFRKTLRHSIDDIKKPSIRRLARRGGVKRIRTDIYEEVRTALKERLEAIMRKAVAIAEHRARPPSGRNCMVTLPDVLFAVRLLGQTLYYFKE